MFKLVNSVALIVAFSQVTAQPEAGCYVYNDNPMDLQIRAQIKVISDSTLDFALDFQAPPELEMSNALIVCENEKYSFDSISSEITIAAESVSSCMQSLVDFSKGVVQIPMKVKYTASTKSFTTKLVIDIELSKVAVCETFGTATTTLAPAGTTNIATATPSGRISTPTRVTSTTTTTTKASGYSAVSALVLGSLFFALLL